MNADQSSPISSTAETFTSRSVRDPVQLVFCSRRDGFGSCRGDAWLLTFFTLVSAAMALFLTVLLRVLAARLGDTAERGGRSFTGIVREGNIAKRDNANQALIAVDHGETPNLDVGHVRGDFVQLLIVEAVTDLGAHNVAHWGIWVLAFGHGADGNVAVGNHPDKTIISPTGRAPESIAVMVRAASLIG